MRRERQVGAARRFWRELLLPPVGVAASCGRKVVLGYIVSFSPVMPVAGQPIAILPGEYTVIRVEKVWNCTY